MLDKYLYIQMQIIHVLLLLDLILTDHLVKHFLKKKKNLEKNRKGGTLLIKKKNFKII